MGSARLLPFAFEAPARNMAIDEAILHAGQGTTLRFYGWSPPAVSLGWFQRDIDGARFRRAGYEVVRRMTGGGAVVHHHEVTYSLALPLDHPILRGITTAESYAVIHAPIRRALSALGVETTVRAATESGDRGPSPTLCFERSTSLDLLAGGKKLVGSAQRRLRDRMLQHGSIILDRNDLQPDTACVSDRAGRTVAPRELVLLLIRAFEDLLGPLEAGGLTAEERARAGSAELSFSIA